MIDWELTVKLENTIWQSDWNGYEVGFPDVDVIGLYMQQGDYADYYYYIDIEKKELLGFWTEREEY